MIKYYKTVGNRLELMEKAAAGCWVSVVAPDEQEIEFLISQFGLDAGFVRSSLDEEESSHVEIEDEQTLIIVDTPVAEVHKTDSSLFYTMPIGIIITDDYVFTISAKDNSIITEIENGAVKNMQTNMKTRFVLQCLLKITSKFLFSLKQIEKLSYGLEQQLQGALKNQELIQLLGLEKSLVYFSTSLKANDVTLEKINRGRVIKLYEEDQDLLEDVLIEVNQAKEMTNIYSGILSGMMDAFSSVISNNLNMVMWRLTVITIILAIPTMVFSFYGMNTNLPLPYTWFASLAAVLLTVIVSIVLLKKKK
ncbi:MAG: magnesium transporter CorA family protein [Oscillospiraceae bacterium]|nr:magnesium transporter CorA family protein [Oscillospiraceae bacterium]